VAHAEISMEGRNGSVDRIVEGLRQSPVRLEAFRRNVATVLRGTWFHLDGNPATLAAYLDSRKAAKLAGGDEQAVVDQLTPRLLEALGYLPADIRYNVTSGRARADYTVHLSGSLVTVPLFVVEDKATDIKDFRKKQQGRAGDESPVEQLRRYTRTGRMRGNAGILCNGWTLEAWQFAREGDSRVVHVDLYALAKHVTENDGAPLSEALVGSLNALWIRFSRPSFEEVLEQKPIAPKPTADWAARIQEAFKESPGAADKVFDQHLEEAWQKATIDVTLAPDLLVDTLRTLIDGFTDDVRHQLDDALACAKLYDEELERTREQCDTAALMIELRGSWRMFDLTDEEYLTRVTHRVESWLASPKPGGMRKVLAAVRRDLEAHVRVEELEEAVQPSLLPDAPPKIIAKVSKADQEARRREVLSRVEEVVRDLYALAVLARTESDRLYMEYGASVEAARAFNSWVERVSASVMVGANNETLRAEFARQTAYVYIVRLLLVRICEDKGLFQRKLSDGGLVRWEEQSDRYLDYAAGRSYEYLTQMAYDCAQNVYVHFYGASRVFDWYHMDEKILTRSILAMNAFDLRHIDADIIGTVYGQYLREGKHEQGRYYTPRPLVGAMLDAMGYSGPGIVGRRLGDLACGSGSFLVEACRRLLDRYKDTSGRIPTNTIENALEEIQRSLFGFDINPFACYLAETNLLIQVLDLVKRAQEESLSFTIDRFAIYSTDSLLVNDDLTLVPGTATGLFNKDEVLPELAKARAGDFDNGFDFLVGNPPYVRADEKAENYLKYRRKIEDQSWFTTQYLKWDLYVPFVEQYHRLLSSDEDARACLVTIESIATSPYAEKLRELLAHKSTLYELFFLDDLELFPDASWQNSIVFCFSRHAPSSNHEIERRVCRRQTDDTLFLEPLDVTVQAETTPDRLLKKRPEASVSLANTVRWDEICYVSVGMVLNSNEDLEDGTVVDVGPSYDPSVFGEELVQDRGKKGKRIRHKKFGRDDLVTTTSDRIHTRQYIPGKGGVRVGGLGPTLWLEYGPHTRCPARVRRPTFPELYDRTKIMFGTFTGVAVDDGSCGQFLTMSDSLRLSIRWILLEDVVNRALSEARNELKEGKRYDPALSLEYSEWYLCAIALSEPIRRWLHANKRSMKEHVYPDDIKAIPVKRISPLEQQSFIDLAKERHRLWSELTALEAEGYVIGAVVELPVHALVDRFRKDHAKMRHLTLVQAVAAGLFRIEDAYSREPLRGAHASGASVVLKRRKVAEVGEGIEDKTGVAKVVARILGTLPATFSERQGIDKIPGTEQGLLDLGAWLDELKAAVERRQRRIKEIGAAIDRLAWVLYKP
jgi:type I restriction enzyme M protein